MVGPRNSCGCSCETRVSAVTIKAFHKSDGTTEWEYGPGSWWRHHYGADEITGIQADTAATLDAYVIAASDGESWVLADNRNLTTLTANACECLSLVKLNALDGTVIETAVMGGMFVSAVFPNGAYVMVNGLEISETAGLSGGDYVIAGRRVPVIEFVDFSSNTATKNYVLHGHNQRSGNVYLQTRTSAETITLPYNATASAVEAAFESTSDCVSATATGGPWPLAGIDIEVEWSVSGGDISAIKIDGATTGSSPGTGTSEWQFDAVAEVWNLIANNCTTGTPVPPNYNPGFPATDFGTCEIAGVSSPTEGAATTYDTGTGTIVNTVGRIFGASTTITAQKLVDAGASVPSVTQNANEAIYHMVSGPSNTLGIMGTGFNYIESWTPSSTWSNNWQKFINTIGGANFSSPRLNLLGAYSVEQGKLLVNFQNRLYAGDYKAAAHIDMTSGTVTEIINAFYSPSTINGNNTGQTYLLEGDSSTTVEYPRGVLNPFGERVYNFGIDTHIDGTSLFLGRSFHAGVDSSNVYGTGIVAGTVAQILHEYYGTFSSTTNSVSHFWRFRTVSGARFTNAAEFRFVFRGGFTPWIAWDADQSEIEAAILTVYPQNTEGLVSNARLPWGGFPNGTLPDNTYFSWLERGVEIEFQAFRNIAGRNAGYIPPTHVTAGRITIEVRNAVGYNPEGIVAWDRTNGDLVWSRAWGTPVTGGSELQYPRYIWTRGDFVFAYGDLVENDL
jgi:hypothetical protein